MKKALCLLFCLLLFFCSACQKEEFPEKPNADVPPTPSEEFVPEIDADSFYTYDGNLHNTYVNLMLTEKDLSYRKLFDERLAELSLEVNPVVEIGNTFLLLEFLELGLGVSFLPDYVTKKAYEEGKIVYLDVRDFDIDVWE